MRLYAIILTLIAALTAHAADDPMRLRADRAYDWDDYAGAAAMYEVLISRTPDNPDLYTRAIVSQQMLADSAATIDLMQRAMAHGFKLSDMLATVRQADFAKGRAELYATYLVDLRDAMPWMTRALDNQLLQYYDFRNDGPMIEQYARRMLAPLPDSVEYLTLLARGLLLQGKIDQAAAVWQQILTLDPTDPGARNHLEALGR